MLTLEKKPVNLPVLLQQLVDKFSVQTKKEVRFMLNINLEDEEVQVDPIYLSNAISNLFD